MIRIFSKGRTTLKSDVDAWVVEWYTYKAGVVNRAEYPNVKKCYQVFTDKNEATEYADVLKDAIKLLGITSLPKVKVYKYDADSISI